MQEHIAREQHHHCHCGGYHFKHRKGSPYCHHNPLSPIREVTRHGDDESTITGLVRSIAEERPDLHEQIAHLCAQLGIQFN